MDLARGVYQRKLIRGEEAWSGSTLMGEGSSKHGANYARSRATLLKRMGQDKIHFEFRKVGRRTIMVIGKTPAPTAWERLLDEED